MTSNLTDEQIAWIQSMVQREFDDRDAWSTGYKDTKENIKLAEKSLEHAEKLFEIKLDRTFIEGAKFYNDKYRNK